MGKIKKEISESPKSKRKNPRRLCRNSAESASAQSVMSFVRKPKDTTRKQHAVNSNVQFVIEVAEDSHVDHDVDEEPIPLERSSRTYGRQQLPRDLTVYSTLVLECENEGLSEVQLRAQNEAKLEFKQAHDKINEMIKNQTILFQSKQTMVLQSATPNITLRPPVGKMPIPMSSKLVPGNTIKVVNSSKVIAAKAAPSILRTQNRQGVQLLQTTTNSNVTYVLQQGPKNSNSTVLRALPAGTMRITSQNLSSVVTSAQAVTSSSSIPLGQQQIASVQTAPAPPIATGESIVDLTQEDTVDSREITFNKLSGKTFPSLVVSARPNLRMKDMTPSAITKERANLDAKVKTVLVCSPTKFTEWLIQQGLVRSEQFCSTHRDMTNSPVKLKLGMYSDNTKFPFSGGYVWISECCPQKFVSVFSGSLFESSPHPPTILLKLVYHWCCQTSVNNVVQWVKVDNFYVKNFFTLLRSVCTAAVHAKMGYIGGMNKFVEVGVISLGTTSQDGNQRQVKVEVLGVLDFESKRVRLMAVEPMADSDRNLRKRFSKILEPLTSWVHPASTILTDFSIDKSTLQALGFNTVIQNNSTDPGTMVGGKWRNNSNIMDYLRKVVPRMFLNTLSLLNRSLIQQFLDELTWREMWGFSPPLTFDNIISHLAEQTKADYPEQLVNRLSNIALNPFKDWNYLEQPKAVPAQTLAPPLIMPTTVQTTAATEFEVTPSALCEVQYAPGPAHSKRPRAQKTPQPIMNQNAASNANAIKRVKLNTSAQTYLDAFYYADMAGQTSCVISDQDSSFNIKCIICPNTFYNNIALMKHLIAHVVYETNDQCKPGKDLFCHYCLKKVATLSNQQAHKKDQHMCNTAGTSCCICQKKFTTRSLLIQHMSQAHVASEMPYRCNICHFRSSFHYKLVDHFYETHTGGSSLQCPLCLKVFFASGSRSRNSSSNLMAFYQHLVGHKRQSNRRKCERCCLIFQQTKSVYEHEDQDHRSMRNVPRVVPVVSTESNPTIIIPTPTNPPPQSQADKASESGELQTTTTGKNSYTKKPLLPTPDVEVEEMFKCIECREPMDQESHFGFYMNCLQCPFSTCCANAMEEHIKVYHWHKKNPRPAPTKDTQFLQPMYCICGFKSTRGNELANHLEECERRTAYPTPGIQAQSASFPPLVNLEGGNSDDLHNKWMQAYVVKNKDDAKEEAKPEKPDDGSIMGFLGLVRKPSTDEDATIKKSSADEAPDLDPPKEDIDVDLSDSDEPPELPLETQVTESSEVMELDDD